MAESHYTAVGLSLFCSLNSLNILFNYYIPFLMHETFLIFKSNQIKSTEFRIRLCFFWTPRWKKAQTRAFTWKSAGMSFPREQINHISLGGEAPTQVFETTGPVDEHEHEALLHSSAAAFQ